MTEEQRMEEGRRMFQIFAARMFEQRVLQAYREKVSKERQEKLLEEIDEEAKLNDLKKAKKAKDAQKKKEKAAQKKQALAEEKAKKESEKAAEEAAAREAAEKLAQEQRLKNEERRKKREAQKKAEEEERARKEADKQRRLQEARERQAETERKAREAKEKQRKEQEELRLKEKEARETRERETKERREKQERDKREKEAKAKTERDSREKQKRDELALQQSAVAQAAIAATQAKRPPVPIPVNLQSQQHPIASPHIPVATPAIPKAPTPIKVLTTSQQGSSNSSVPQTPQVSAVSSSVSPITGTPSQGSPGSIGPPGKAPNQNPFLHQPQATSPIHSALKSPPGMPQPNPFGGLPPINMGFQPGMPMMAPGFSGMFPHQPLAGQFRPMNGPNSLPMHPGFMPQGRGFPLPPHAPPGFAQQIPNLGGIGQPFPQNDGPPSATHSRQQSGTFEAGGGSQAQPIARPAPIGRPSSIVHGQRRGELGSNDMDDLSNHLGSSALLDDSDEPFTSSAGARRSSAAPGGMGRQNFIPPFGMEPPPYPSPINGYNGWGAPPNPFGTSSLPGSGFVGGWGQSANSSFSTLGSNPPLMRSSQPRSVQVRLKILQVFKKLEGSKPDGFYDLNTIKEQVDQFTPPSEPAIPEKEILEICETEGSAINGGGSFDIRHDDNGNSSIRYEPDLPSTQRSVGGPGEIGSPIIGNGTMARFGGPPGF
jgi:hypothetical protein